MDCARQDPQPALRIAPDVLAMLRQWQKTDDPNLIRRIRSEPIQEQAMDHLLSQFLRYHVELPLPSRDTAYSIMGRDAARLIPMVPPPLTQSGTG